MAQDDHTFDSLLDTVECPACGAEVEEGAPTCPTCMQDLRIALAPDTRPRVTRWILDGIDIPEWAQRKKWLWVWGVLYVALLGVIPLVDRFVVHTGVVFWVALGVVVLIALVSWVMYATWLNIPGAFGLMRPLRSLGPSAVHRRRRSRRR